MTAAPARTTENNELFKERMTVMSRKAGKWYGARQGDLEDDTIEDNSNKSVKTQTAAGSADMPLWLRILIVWLILR